MTVISIIKKSTPRSFRNFLHLISAVLAVLRYRYPARGLTVIGVTGTDGKTTTSTLIYEMLKTSGKKVALVSTVAAYIGNQELDTGFHVTAPDAWLLQKLIRKIKDLGYKYVVLEATSHGLDQHRLFGSNIKVSVLTNITHEHLDYHGSYKNYVKAKGKLFRKTKVAIINKTDSSHSFIKKYINRKAQIISYNLNTATGSVKSAIKLKFPEIYNQLNATAAYHAANSVGVKDKDIVQAVKNFKGVIGRMEEIKNNKGFRIIVDFAHTPNALEMVLSELRKQKTKDQRLIAVFGCASERDDKKRPMMGEISSRLADISIFTAEDPRREDINKIISEMVIGANKVKTSEINMDRFEMPIHRNEKRHYFVRILERGEAISFAINKLAKRGDIVVICGKGHEKSMSYNGKEYAWSDHDAVNLALKGKVLEIKR